MFTIDIVCQRAMLFYVLWPFSPAITQYSVREEAITIQVTVVEQWETLSFILICNTYSAYCVCAAVKSHPICFLKILSSQDFSRCCGIPLCSPLPVQAEWGKCTTAGVKRLMSLQSLDRSQVESGPNSVRLQFWAMCFATLGISHLSYPQEPLLDYTWNVAS